VALEPAVLGAKRVGNGHSLGGDEDVKACGELFEHVLRAGHEGQVFEKVFCVKEGAQLLLAIEGSDLPQSLARQVAGGDVFVEGLVVAAEVLGESVRHNLVHVHTDALHGLLLSDGNFRVGRIGVDGLKWLFPQEKAILWNLATPY
jgi:hypothetical protein